ncbi:aldo/keto reductase [Youngiibacter multivorans]|uniref:Diketogulonate reductase-like aldo/keto reductase n=1 Tax=Youngiibacter multivorans TaxID=937251 RepID=A0ABS4G8X2_9CLOT|nr:aldo/keto reductase [Youngiibacter multivorans]MBP1920984.1 diketogulonate reductase-like aldo/keto reductase [Youngiibacter multivorans]
MEDFIKLNDGSMMPRLGQGTWYMGEDTRKRADEITSLRFGIELGMTLIDTAEMYGEGLSEELIGEAISDVRRENLFIVSKVYPHNAGRRNIFNSCKKSLDRLGTDYLDMYLLHWRGRVPLSETVACMEELKKEGLIRNWGVSNFDTDDMEELLSVPFGANCRVNQVLYNLGSRGIEYDLLPFMRSNGMATMAYCPMAHDRHSRKKIAENAVVKEISSKYGITPEQLMLAFVLSNEGVCALPKASSPEHVRQNAAAIDIRLTPEDLDMLAVHFPSPKRKMTLDML